MKAVLYVRVSTRDQENGYSLDAQEREGRRYAQLKDLEIVKSWRVSESAWKEERTAFRELIEFVRKRKDIRVIIFDSVDRMTRNIWDAYQILKFVQEYDKEIHFSRSAKVLTKHSGPDDSFMMGIETLTAKRYSDEISFKVKRALGQKAEQGLYPTIAPLGYRNCRATKGIEPDPEGAAYLKRLFELAATGMHSLDYLTDWAFQSGLRSKRGGRITRSHFHRLLKNPLYAGYFYWTGKLYQGVHEPLISKDLFDRVQQALGRRYKPKTTKRSFVFQGIMTCATCGHAIVGELRKEKYTYYHCTRCRGTYVREEEIDARMVERFRDLYVDSRQAQMLRDMVIARREALMQSERQQQGALAARNERLETWIEQAYVDKLEGKITEDEWRNRTNRWKEEQIVLSGQIEKIKRTDPKSFEHVERVLELLQRLPSLYLMQDHSQKRLLLKNLLSNCTLAYGSPFPTYRKPFDVLAEGLPRHDWRGGRDSNPRPPA